jgi:hypothetical protein
VVSTKDRAFGMDAAITNACDWTAGGRARMHDAIASTTTPSTALPAVVAPSLRRPGWAQPGIGVIDEKIPRRRQAVLHRPRCRDSRDAKDASKCTAAVNSGQTGSNASILRAIPWMGPRLGIRGHTDVRLCGIGVTVTGVLHSARTANFIARSIF